MNQREPTAAPLGAGQALPCLALLLLLMAVVRAWSRPMQPSRPASVQEVPYLVALGAPPLRFLEPAPPPDLVSRPPAAAPPHPSDTDEVASPSAEPVAQTAPPPSPLSLPTPVSAPADSAPASEAEASVPAPTRTPQPILPDEIRPQARPEDFLPFFQIPSTQPGDPSVIVPVPRASVPTTPLPPSSATYTQTPR
jgi:hypothetical protein